VGSDNPTLSSKRLPVQAKRQRAGDQHGLRPVCGGKILHAPMIPTLRRKEKGRDGFPPFSLNQAAQDYLTL
jgi:hypothetical protein